jgi:hypothetical protein
MGRVISWRRGGVKEEKRAFTTEAPRKSEEEEKRG